MSRVVLEQIIHVLKVERIGSAIRISRHRFEWQRFDGESVSRVEVHIFLVAVHEEEVIACPAGRQRWKFRRIEFQRDFVAGAEDDELVIERSEQRKNITIPGVVARLPREGARRTDLLVYILHVATRLAFDLTGVAIE